jgi:hypothetical protein
VGTVEDEVAILVRGDYDGVALLAFGLDSSPQTRQAVFVMRLVEDQAIQLNQTEVFEGGDQVPEEWRDRPLCVSPATAPEKVEQDETAEEEERDDEEEPYDAKK